MKQALICAVLVLGCGSTESRPVQTTSSTVAAPSPLERAHDASVASLRREGNDVTVSWSRDTSGTFTLPSADARAVLHDVTRDGKPELVVFGKETWIIGLSPAKKPARMWRLEAQTLGAKDEASLDAELSQTTLGTTTTSPVKLIARLPLATSAELKALVGAKGVKLCHRQAMKKTCMPITQQSIDAAMMSKITEQQVAEFEPVDGEFGLQVPSCSTENNLITCTASAGGPMGGSWVFEKTASGLRLAEVWSWAEDT